MTKYYQVESSKVNIWPSAIKYGHVTVSAGHVWQSMAKYYNAWDIYGSFHPRMTR